MENTNIDRKKAIFSLIYKLIRADNQIHQKETSYILNLANFLKLDPGVVQNIIKNPIEFELVPPPSEQERMTILYYMLFSMRIDENINETEEKVVYQAGLKLGFQESMLREMIGLMKKYLTTKLPNDALIEIIKKYLN